LWRGLALVCGAAVLLVLMAYMSGILVPSRVGPETRVPDPPEAPSHGGTCQASLEIITEVERAVGTVRPRTETSIEAQVTARILEVKVRPGDEAEKGDILIVLDAGQLQARLDQARQAVLSAQARKLQADQAVHSAEAVLTEAEAAYNRTRNYFENEAATEQDMERARSSFLQARSGVEHSRQRLQEAEAGVRQAEKAVEEARIALSYTRILTPESGRVAKRTAEPGDMAWPGKTLMVLHTRGAFRLESLVREGLIDRIRVGNKMRVYFDVLDETFEGLVDEVVPTADPVTRTFLVKVDLPRLEGLYPGMFGRLLVPVGDRRIVTVPLEAVIRVGQLEMVTVRAVDRWERVFIKTGRIRGDRVEVLAGLEGLETLLLHGVLP
jgi:HlyD family secretion protein